MQTTTKIDMYFNRVLSIRYENENGGAYAFIQYLAYTRELLVMLRPLKKVEKHLETIEAINWLFNEHLAFKFSHRHKAIFDEKINVTKKLFDAMRENLKEIEYPSYHQKNALPALAA
jgi:hypothetical protein